MTFEAMNYKDSGGSFSKRVRVLQTFTIHFNEVSDRYTVTDDRDGRTAGAGFATHADAVRAFERTDYARYGV